MYHEPAEPRTDAWKPRGVRSKRTVVLTSPTATPLYVLISGCFLARPASITGDSWIEKPWKLPSGVGSARSTDRDRAAFVISRGARLIRATSDSRSSLNVRMWSARTAAFAPRKEAP